MAIHGSQRWQNVKASVFAHLLTLTIAGSPVWVFEGQARAQATHNGLWARATVLPVQEATEGLWSATARATRVDLLLVVDLFAPDGSEADVHNAYALDAAADDLAFALRALDLALLDYAADSDSPSTLTGHAIRTMDVARSERTTSDGYDRVQLRVDAYHFAQHAL